MFAFIKGRHQTFGFTAQKHKMFAFRVTRLKMFTLVFTHLIFLAVHNGILLVDVHDD